MIILHNGICIGFSTKSLDLKYRLSQNSLEINESLSLHNVLYSYQDQKELLLDLIREYYNKSKRIKDAESYFSIAITNLLMRLNPIFKTNQFQTEKEWRIIYLPIIVSYNDQPFENSDGRNDLLHIFCRNKINTYYPFNFKESINEIILGPKNRSTEFEIKSYLESKGLYKTIVYNSEVPYR